MIIPSATINSILSKMEHLASSLEESVSSDVGDEMFAAGDSTNAHTAGAADIVDQLWDLCTSHHGRSSFESDSSNASTLRTILTTTSLPVNTLRDAGHHTLLMRACGRSGNEAAAKVLLSLYYFADGTHLDLLAVDRSGNTALHHAVMGGHLHTVQLLLDTISINSNLAGLIEYIETGNSNGSSSLHLAAELGRLEVLKTLLAAGHASSGGRRTQRLDLNAQNFDGESPLHLSCLHSHAPIVHHLVRAERANPLVFNLAGELPSDVTDNLQIRRFLMAATQYQLLDKGGPAGAAVAEDKRHRVEQQYELAARALLDEPLFPSDLRIPSTATSTAAPTAPATAPVSAAPVSAAPVSAAAPHTPPRSLPASPLPISPADHSGWAPPLAVIPLTPTGRSPLGLVKGPRSPFRRFHAAAASASAAVTSAAASAAASPEVARSARGLNPVSDGPQLYDTYFRAMAREARQVIENRTQHSPHVGTVFRPTSPPKKSPAAAAPSTRPASSPSKAMTNLSAQFTGDGHDSRRFLSASEKFARSIEKYDQRGRAGDQRPVASKTAPLDTGVVRVRPSEKLVVEFNSEGEIVFKTLDGRLANQHGQPVSQRGAAPSTPGRLRSKSAPVSTAAKRQQSYATLMSQPKNKVERAAPREPLSKGAFPSGRNAAPVASASSMTANAGSSRRSQSSSRPARPSEAAKVATDTPNRSRRATINEAPRSSGVGGIGGPNDSFMMGQYRRMSSRMDVIDNPLAGSGADRRSRSASKSRGNGSTGNANSSGNVNYSSVPQPPLSPTKAYLARLTPSKPYMVPTTSSAVSGGVLLEKRGTPAPTAPVLPRSQSNRYHQKMPNTELEQNTEFVELQLFLSTLNRILELHTNGLKKMFYRWKHFKLADPRKRLTSQFAAVASTPSGIAALVAGSGDAYDDSHVVQAAVPVPAATRGSAVKANRYLYPRTTLHVSVTPGHSAANLLDQVSPVSMSDLSSSTIDGKINKIKKTASQLRLMKVNSPYATLRSATKLNSPSKRALTVECGDTFEHAVYQRIEPMIRANEFTLEKIYFHFCSNQKAGLSKISSIPVFDRCLMSEIDLWYLLMTFGVCPQVCSKVQLSHCIRLVLATHVPTSGVAAVPIPPEGTPAKGRALVEESMECGIISFIHFVKILWQVSYLCKSSAADHPPPSVQFAYLLQIMDSSGGRQKIAQLSRSARMIPPFVYLNILSDIY